MKHLLALIALAFAWAAQAAAPGTSTSLYNVEVLVFENRMPSLEGGELWTQDKVRPLPDEASNPLVPGLPEDPVHQGPAPELAPGRRGDAHTVTLTQ